MTPLHSITKTEIGHITAISDGHFVTKESRQIVMRDLITGDIQWIIDDDQLSDSLVCLTDEYVHCVDILQQSYATLRRVDGSPVDIRKNSTNQQTCLVFQELPNHDDVVAVIGPVIVLEQRINLESGRLIGYDLDRKRQLWNLDISSRTNVGQLDVDRLVVHDTRNNTLTLLQPEQVDPVLKQVIVPDLMAESLTVLQDHANWYVHLSEEMDVPSNSLGRNHGAEVHGQVVAINKKTLQPVWQTEIRQQRIIPSQPSGWPFLVYGIKVNAAKADENGERSYEFQSHIQLIDKATGKLIYEMPQEIQQRAAFLTFETVPEQLEYVLRFSTGDIRVKHLPPDSKL